MEDEDESNSQKAKDKGVRRAMQKALEKGSDIADTFTGKRVEELVTEYSDLHTKVVLGLCQDVEVQSAEVDNLKTVRVEDIEKLNHFEEHVGHLEGLVQEHSESSTRVIMGLRRDLEAQSAEVENLKTVRAEDIEKLSRLAEHVGRLEDLVQEHNEVSTQVIVGLRRDIGAHHAVTGQARAISLIALAISVVALVGVVWNAV